MTVAAKNEIRNKFHNEFLAISYIVSKDLVKKAMTTKKAQKKRMSPNAWLVWIKTLGIQCPECKGSKRYKWGTNGHKSGPCYRCESKGHITASDGHRCRTYDNHRKV